MKELEKSLKALANKRRLAILKFLKKNKEASVSQIASEIKLSFKATSKHLWILLASDIIEKDQRSLYMIYTISQTLRPEARHIISIL